MDGSGACAFKCDITANAESISAEHLGTRLLLMKTLRLSVKTLDRECNSTGLFTHLKHNQNVSETNGYYIWLLLKNKLHTFIKLAPSMAPIAANAQQQPQVPCPRGVDTAPVIEYTKGMK